MRVSGPDFAAAELQDARHLLVTVRAQDGVRQSVDLPEADADGWYVVTAYDRLWHQSAPSLAAHVD